MTVNKNEQVFSRICAGAAAPESGKSFWPGVSDQLQRRKRRAAVNRFLYPAMACGVLLLIAFGGGPARAAREFVSNLFLGYRVETRDGVSYGRLELVPGKTASLACPSLDLSFSMELIDKEYAKIRVEVRDKTGKLVARPSIISKLGHKAQIEVGTTKEKSLYMLTFSPGTDKTAYSADVEPIKVPK